MRIPGGCGELVQGTLDGERPFLVTCPIDWYSEVTVVLNGVGEWAYSPAVPKAVQAVRLTLDTFGVKDRGFELYIDSDLPVSKGLGSSTADVTAAIYATAEALGEEIEPQKAAELAVSIEPSDSLMFPGLALFDHRNGVLYESLGPAPPLTVVVLGFEGVVDTLTYNAEYRADLLRQPGVVEAHRDALALLKEGLAEKDWLKVGHGATLSAIAHQRILHKPQLEAAIRLSREMGGLGVCVAHSGTVIGLLFDGEPDVAGVDFDGLEFVRMHKMVGGGPS